MSAASRESAPEAPAVRQPAIALLHAAAVLVAAGGFVFIALEATKQIERLIWRPAEIPHALSAAASLAATFPLRFGCLVLGSIGVMLAAEYRPRAVLRTSTAVWVALGVAGTGAYFLGALNVGSRWAFGVLLGSSLVAAGVLLVRCRADDKSVRAPTGLSPGRAVLPVLVGLVGGLLAVRASIEPVTEWDAVVYHVSFARDWLDSLPSLPHAAGPSVGAELSYNYPALFPSLSVVLAGALHLGAAAVARLVSPLAAITVLAVLRSVVPVGFFSGWAAPMFVLGSTFFVAYGQWPTAYMLMTLFLALAVARIASQRQLGPAAAACIGLAAATGWIGTVLGAMVVVAYGAWTLGERLHAPTSRGHGKLRAVDVVTKTALLVVPAGAVVVASLKQTGGLLFPWITWPHAAHLLPGPYWSATEREILANSYSQFGDQVGTVLDPLLGVARLGLLAPGGLAAAGLVVAAAGITVVRGRPALLLGVVAVATSAMPLVLLELVWPRYFLPMVVAAAAGLGAAVNLLRRRTGRLDRLAYAGALIAASLCLVSGVAYALAGPNDRTYTAATAYRTERASAFETARQAADARARRNLVYGDDSRAWDDVNTLDAANVGVGTFDVRNYFSRYDARRQLDGLAGAAIRGSSGTEVAEDLKIQGIDAVFMPSWFWEPGGARHPLTDRSPVALWVGGRQLRAARVYLPDPYVTYPSVLYAVGSSRSVQRLDRLLETPSFSVEGPLSTRRRVVRGGFALSGPLGGLLHWRIAAPVTELGGPAIRLTTKAVTAARGVGVYEPKVPTLVRPAAFVDCTRVPPWARESELDIILPGSPFGFAYLDTGIAGRTRNFSAVVRELPASARVLLRACGSPTNSRGGIFPAGNTASRIMVENPRGRHLALAFDYRDTGRKNVSFNVYDESRDRWIYGVARLRRCGSGDWIHARLPLDLEPRADLSAIELGPVVTGRDLIVRNLRLVHGIGRQTDCETAS